MCWVEIRRRLNAVRSDVIDRSKSSLLHLSPGVDDTSEAFTLQSGSPPRMHVNSDILA
jgi:hypothetical protein